MQELIGGIRQLDDRLGDEDAPITMTLFQDVQCPRCADFQADVIDPLIEQRVRTGEAQINFRNFPLGLKPVTLGAIGVEAAAEQDRGWQYAELFMRNLDEVPEHGVNQEFLEQVAAVVPKLDTAAWEEAFAPAPPSRALRRTSIWRPSCGCRPIRSSSSRGRWARRRSRTFPPWTRSTPRSIASAEAAPGRPRRRPDEPRVLPYCARLGAWRSLVARTVRVGEVPGSNPGAPICRQPPADRPAPAGERSRAPIRSLPRARPGAPRLQARCSAHSVRA